MLNLTNRVLTISKIEENKLSLNKTHQGDTLGR
jgi:hypothetical protein